MSTEKESWSSQLSFILAATGAAVGLGNIWKFPYMAGQYGGSAFVFVYLICVILISLPIMIAEMMLGRRGRCNSVDCLKQLAIEQGRSPAWQVLGWLGNFTLVLILSFYSVVASWSIAYVAFAAQGVFTGLSAAAIEQFWQQFLAQPWQLLGWDCLFMLITMLVVAGGIQAGIERATTTLMPALLLILLALVAYATKVGDVKTAIHFLFAFKLSVLTTNVIISAMGHAFFTLAVGAGCMLTYGAYLNDEVHLGKTVFIIAALNLLVAILAGLAIFPLVFAEGLSPAGGPGLMFLTLPISFASMPAGQWVGMLFFMLLLVAAWTSSISLAAPLVSLLAERYQQSRYSAAAIVGFIALVLSTGSLLSFNHWADYKLLGRWNFFDCVTNLATNILLPLGGLGYAIFSGWVMDKTSKQQTLAVNASWFFNYWQLAIKYIAPIGILIILVSSLF